MLKEAENKYSDGCRYDQDDENHNPDIRGNGRQSSEHEKFPKTNLHITVLSLL